MAFGNTATHSKPNGGQSATPMAYIACIFRALQDAGLDTDKWLAQVQITPAAVHNPKATVTASQMEVASDWAMRALNDEALGWFERPLPWGSYGMLARASMGAPNLGTAMHRWCRHHGLLTNRVTLNVGASVNGLVDVHLLDHGVAPVYQEFCHVTLLRNLLGFCSWAVDSRLNLHSAAFACTTPQHASAYTVLFPCEVRFDAPHTCMRLSSSYLDLPLRRSEADLNAMLQRALPLTVRHYRRDRLLVQQVQRLLQSHSRALTANDVADQLNMSARSLFRQLRDEGATWQQLKTKHAMRLAQHALLSHDWPIKQVASHCGFGNEKSFTRAFGKSFGQSPRQFRNGSH